MHLSRRHFMIRAGAFSLGFAGLRSVLVAGAPRLLDFPAAGYGPLIPDTERLLDLPAGFSYHAFSPTGERMDDGFLVPSMHDGMAAFPGPDGLTVLVRNHENERHPSNLGPFGHSDELLHRIDPALLYDRAGGGRPCQGGTTTVVYDTRERRVVRQFLSLAGTDRNCAGGPTPRNTWITCEESDLRAGNGPERDHGYAFEVPATADIAIARPVPLRAMGRFRREACAVDPRTGIVYQTEDIDDGLFYRYLPDNPADLHAGGRLQALAIAGRDALDTHNWGAPAVRIGDRISCRWIDLDDVESPKADLRFRGRAAGAAVFARAEGIWFGNGFAYFCCTSGGRTRHGQFFRYAPGVAEGTDHAQPGTLELFLQPDDPSVIEHPDNITVAPWGDLIVCEDGFGEQFLLGVTPGGSVYRLARNARSFAEFAGAAFSPDGSTLFVNLQNEGLTLAIRGPWRA